MQQEYEGIDSNATFISAELLKSRKAFSTKCIYGWKLNLHGAVIKPKDRLVDLGNLQREDIKQLDTFFPTPVSSSIRLISALTLKLDLMLTHLYIQQPCAQSTLSEVI